MFIIIIILHEHAFESGKFFKAARADKNLSIKVTLSSFTHAHLTTLKGTPTCSYIQLRIRT